MTVILACKCQCIINFHSSLLVSQTSVNHCNYHINQKSQHKLPLLLCCIILKFNIWWKLWFVFLEYLTAACYEQGFFGKHFLWTLHAALNAQPQQGTLARLYCSYCTWILMEYCKQDCTQSYITDPKREMQKGKNMHKEKKFYDEN